jgi:transcriptional regulator with XRE-family HTH domain
MSVRELAGKAGCSSSLISQIEQARVSPSIKTAEKLSRALNLSLADFLRTENPIDQPIGIPRSRKELEVVMSWPGAKVLRVLSPNITTTFTALLLELAIGGSTPVRQAPQSLKDLCFVLAGKVLYRDGANEHPIQAGEGVYVDLMSPHQWVNIGDGLAEVLITSPVAFQSFGDFAVLAETDIGGPNSAWDSNRLAIGDQQDLVQAARSLAQTYFL